jgi:hypothetical protein
MVTAGGDLKRTTFVRDVELGFSSMVERNDPPS